MMIINFSSRTTSMDLQRTLEASVEKRTKDTYGPPMGKRLLVFMDDLNMPRVRMDLYHRSYLTLNFHLIMDSHLFDLRWMNMALSSL